MRRILLTGASSGLGAGLARSYAGPGIELGLVGRNGARLEAVAAECRAAGAITRTGEFDVADPRPLGDWIAAWQATAPIDLAVACAGTSAGPAAIGQAEGLVLATRQVRTNLLGCMNTLEPLLPAMIAARAGHVAVVASVAGYRGLPYSPAYSASKAGVRAYGEALRALLRPAGIAVTVIVPGFFDTPMTDRFRGDKPMLKSLPDMVRVIRRGLDRRRPRIVYPRLLGLGLQAADLLPAAIGDEILRRVPFHIEPGA